MCIICFVPPGILVDDETLQTCWYRNRDGAGFMYPKDGKVIIKKGFTTFAGFLDSYREASDNFPTAPFVIHFRITTHGNTDKTNCHPHRVSSTIGIAHNGIINGVDVPANSPKSDTYLFVKRFLRRLPEGWEENVAIIKLIEGFVGSWNKLAILSGSENVVLINKDRGEWSKGCWFSNPTYKTHYLTQATKYTSWPTKKEEEKKREPRCKIINKAGKKWERLFSDMEPDQDGNYWSSHGAYVPFPADNGLKSYFFMDYESEEFKDYFGGEMGLKTKLFRPVCENCHEEVEENQYDSAWKSCHKCLAEGGVKFAAQ